MAENSEKKEILHPRENNKTNRQRRAEEEKQTKMLKMAGMIAGGVVALLVIVGIIYGISHRASNTVVAKVGEEEIKLDEFQSAVKMQRTNLNQNYQYMAQLYQAFGMEMDSSTKESYAAQMSDAYKGVLGVQVLSNMVDQRIMAYGAEKEGITVSDEEVDAYYKGMFEYYPDGTPTAEPTDEPFEATPTVTDEQLAVLRYTATPEPEAVEEEAVAEEAEAAVEEEAVAEEAEAAVEEEAAVEDAEAVVEEEAAVEDAEAVVEEEAAVEEVEAAVEGEAEAAVEEEPTVEPTAYTEEMFKQYETYYFANNYYYTKEFFKSQLKYELLKEKVEAKLKETLPRTDDMVWARHILVETEEEATAVLERLNAGEEWGDLAAEVSTDTSNNTNAGDLGWFAKGTMVQEFDDAVFSQEVGTVSDPVKTDYGYHLIQLIAHEEHPYTSSQYDTALSTAYQKWLSGYESELEVTLDDNIADKTPTEPAFVG